MKKSILYILFFVGALCALSACKDDSVEISDANKSKTPKNVKLLEYSETSLTICWDFIYGATSYTVQLVDGEMNPVSEALCKTTSQIDYHEFTNLSANQVYYGRVRANFPYSSTSEWVYITKGDQPAMLMASVGVIDVDPQLKMIEATGSTLTYEWAYTDDAATDAARLYNVELFRDAACKELYLSWLADGKLASGKGLFTGLASYPVVRFTFSGLDPETTYYARVTNQSFGNIMTPVAEGKTTQAGPKASQSNPAKTGDILLAQDFSAFIHGGDVVRSAAGYNAVSGSKYRTEWEKATGENPQDEGARPLCNWTTEFHIHTGGTSADYIAALGMTGWGSSGNISTRPGYVKCGGGSGGIGILYTPELTTLPANNSVTVSFSASAYAEGKDVYGSDILVEAVEGATFTDKNVVSKAGTVIARKVVDISEAVGKFGTFSVTLDGLSPTSRVRFSSNPDRAKENKTRYLLDDIVITAGGESHLEKLAAPAGVSFDAAATTATQLKLKWSTVEKAASYTVAYWKGAADAPESDYLYKTEIDAATTEALLGSLAGETKYWAKVKAVAELGMVDSDWSSVVNATTLKPVSNKLPKPANLAAKAGYSTLALTWDAVSDAKGYKVTVGANTQTVTGTSCTVGNLAVGTSYTASVIAVAEVESDNSDASTVQSKTLNVKIVSMTTSSIIFEWEKAETEVQYTVSITEKGTSNSQTYTYDWSKTKGWGDSSFSAPLRFVFHQVSGDFTSGKLSASKNYQLRVKAGTESGAEAWSSAIEGTVRAHSSAAGEIFYEDFDNMPGSDAVLLATGTKSTAKVENLSDMFLSQSAYGWYDGVGGMNLGGGSFSKEVQLAMFRTTGWEIGAIGSSITHNAYNGCFRLGGDNANQSFIKTPAMSGLGQGSAVTVRFKTAAHVFWQTGTPGAPGVSFNGNWRRDQFEAMELYVVHADGTKEKVGATIAVGVAGKEFEWMSHSIEVANLLPTDKLMFTSVASAKSRYYIDEISVVKK